MRYLGIDYGLKRTGLALSDEGGTIALPHSVIPTKQALDEIASIALREKVGTFVIGDSRDFSGAENAIMEQAKAFGRALRERTGLPVEFEQELFTSAEAARPPHKEQKTRKPKTRAPLDAKAAALMLQSFLDRRARAKPLQ